MKHFPFKWVVWCILLPALLYVGSIHTMESYLRYRYSGDIKDTYIGDMGPLLDGSRKLREVIQENIDRYLQHEALPGWAVSTRVLVSTKRGKILYPATFLDLEPSILHQDNLTIAAENYELINEGLILTVDLSLGFGSLLSMVVLMVYILSSIALLYGVYRSGKKKDENEEIIKNMEIQGLRVKEEGASHRLKSLALEHDAMSDELMRIKDALKSEKAKATHAEAELFEEIVSLDSKLKENTEQQQQQLREMDALREEMSAYEAALKKGARAKAKEMDILAKRFKAIYKNLIVYDRALEGFVGLSDDMRIKAEELIYRLNHEPDLVAVKRKVFSKKGRETVLEVLFSYNGRLYFRRTKSQEVEILTIGTKNSQSKDLEYINNVARRAGG